MKTLYGYILILIVMLSINLWVTAGALIGIGALLISYIWVKFKKLIFKKK